MEVAPLPIAYAACGPLRRVRHKKPCQAKPDGYSTSEKPCWLLTGQIGRGLQKIAHVFAG
jgi:hypothetical protein